MLNSTARVDKCAAPRRRCGAKPARREVRPTAPSLLPDLQCPGGSYDCNGACIPASKCCKNAQGLAACPAANPDCKCTTYENMECASDGGQCQCRQGESRAAHEAWARGRGPGCGRREEARRRQHARWRCPARSPLPLLFAGWLLHCVYSFFRPRLGRLPFPGGLRYTHRHRLQLRRVPQTMLHEPATLLARHLLGGVHGR